MNSVGGLYDGESSENEEEFQENFQKTHNKYRKKHGAPPLSLDQKVSHEV